MNSGLLLLAAEKETPMGGVLESDPAPSDAAAEQPARAPRLVRKVVVTYDLPALPPTLLRNFSLLRRKLERAGFKIEVGLRPVTQLPPDVDVVFAPTEIVEAARQAAPGAHVLALALTEAHPPAFDELVEQLNSGQALCAARIEAGGEDQEAQRRVIVRYRGRERLY